MLATNAALGPPNCDQLSMHTALTVFPHSAEVAVEPAHEPISSGHIQTDGTGGILFAAPDWSISLGALGYHLSEYDH